MKMSFKLPMVTIAIIGIISVAVFYAPPVLALDASTIGVDKLGDLLNLGSNDPRDIATQLINVALGFLSLLFLIMILRAGFMFMISGGDQIKTDAAKRSIFNAIIGAILVVSAWSIVTYALDALIKATQG